MDRQRATNAVAELLGWSVIAGVGVVMLTQAVGWNGTRLVAALQTLTPYGSAIVLVVAAIAVWTRREAVAAAGAAVGIGAFVLSIPLVIVPDQAPPAPDAAAVHVASVNLLFENPMIEVVADRLLELDPDVIVFSEYTTAHRRVLSAHPLRQRYEHQVDRDALAARGMAVWSKFGVEANAEPTKRSRTVDATLRGPDGPIKLIAVHPPTPIFDFEDWEGELERIGELAASATDPTLVIGDFNASYWHPVFRDLLRRDLTDAHIANGSGWSTSWPTDRIIPPFVRLDHALTGNGMVSTGVEDFSVPGSDHAGLVVTVTLSG